ncbi:pyridoxal kinase [Coccinella septempunctata]|uniref:pyridoxal kinase n=1 Tax=Coccinella septempunctata TaxID=41139 RepID=UPI001D084505|nr:pyridoxal kinase [Coccinella septempunctata]
MAEDSSPKVLSIQSHVVHGYVGNRSAVFPLQLLGFEVDFINSVQLCTHTQYKKVTGQILKEQDLSDLFQGLKENGLDKYDYLLTGYVGSPSFLKEIVAVYKHLKSVNPNIVFVCDPVMGDNGEFYVPEELVPLYREQVVPHAHILTPNQFELESLTNMTINNVEDCWEAIEKLHLKGCKTVVVSSSDLGGNGHLLALASTKMGESCQRVTITLEKKQAIFVGTGDIFAALMLAWMHKSNNNLKESLEKTIASLQATLERTLRSAEGKPHTPENLELKLIQSKRDIEEPKVTLFANCTRKSS